MVRIGRNVTFDGSREIITDKLVGLIDSLALPDINFSFVNDNTINIYGEDTDLITLRDAIIAKGFTFTINGAAPTEPTGEDPPTPIDWDPVILKQAFENIKEEDRDALWTRILAEYTLLGGTGNPPRVDFKWLR